MYNKNTKIGPVTSRIAHITLSEISLYLYSIYITVVLFSYSARLNNNFILLTTIMLAITIAITSIGKRNEKILGNGRFAVILVIFLISTIVATINGYVVDRSVQYMYCFLVFVLVSMSLQSAKAYSVLLRVVTLTAAFFVFITIISVIDPRLAFYPGYLAYTDPSIIVESASNGIYIGLAGEQSYNGYITSIFLIICFVDSFMLIKNKIFGKAIFPLGLIGLLISRKRSLILAVPTLLIFLFMLYGKGSKRIKNLAYIAFSVFILTFFVNAVFPELLSSVIEKMIVDNNINLNHRDTIWGIAIVKFLENPLFGIGINRFDVYFYEFYMRLYSNFTYTSFAGAHNFYYQYLAELGVLGFSGLIAVIFYELAKSMKYSRFLIKSNDTFLLRLILISTGIQLLTMLYGLSGNSLHQYQQLFMYLIAIGMSHFVGKQIKNKQSTGSQTRTAG